MCWSSPSETTCRAETDAKLLKKDCLLSHGHRRLAIIQRRGPGPWDRTPARARPMEEQQELRIRIRPTRRRERKGRQRFKSPGPALPTVPPPSQHLQRPTPPRSPLTRTARVRAAAMTTPRTAISGRGSAKRKSKGAPLDRAVAGSAIADQEGEVATSEPITNRGAGAGRRLR